MLEWWTTCKAHLLYAVVLDVQAANLIGQLPSEIGQLSKLGEFDRQPTFSPIFVWLYLL
jgi:hypothetical protein